MDVRVSEDELHGRTVVIKRATAMADVQRLLAEAEWLRIITHPGVVELLDFVSEAVGEAEVVELTTVFAGSVTLADVSPAGAGSGAAVVAAVAAVVADLHAAGVAHGQLSSDHVIIAKTGQPVLCSLGRASAATPDSVRADVEALARLLDQVLRGCDSAVARTPRRQARALRRLIAWCESPDASALELAGKLVAVPGVSLAPGGEEPDLAEADRGPTPAPVVAAPPRPVDAVPPARTWRDRVVPESKSPDTPKVRFRYAIAASVALLALSGLRIYLRNAPSDVAPPTQDRLTPGALIAPLDPAPSVPGLPLTACANAPSDQPGCSSDVTVTGNLIRVGDKWYEAGLTGDHVILGDWDCDGRSTPALLRPDTGEVFVFAAWPSPGGEIETPLAARVTNQIELVAERSADCDVLFSLGSAPSDDPTLVEGP